jgi:hypothetical protein
MKRREICIAALATSAFGGAYANTKKPSLEVWKSPECGCCKGWIAHMEKNGYSVAKVHDNGNTDARKALGIPLQFGSCHTARVGPYALEGHVPAREVARLLAERPAAVGLAVPAMPLGSPGMDGPDFDNQTQPYDVLLVLKDGSTRVFQSYR